MRCLILVWLLAIAQFANAQVSPSSTLALLRQKGLHESTARKTLDSLCDTYGSRLTGSRQYLAAAQWARQAMTDAGLTNAHFEPYCTDCRGWELKSFNAELVAPNYMKLIAYPFAYTRQLQLPVTAEVVNVPTLRNMPKIHADYGDKVKGKIILLGILPPVSAMDDSIMRRFGSDELSEMNEQLLAEKTQKNLYDQLEGWKKDDIIDQDFLKFADSAGAVAVFKTQPMSAGVLQVTGSYYYRQHHMLPLPYFAISPEHYSRLYRMIASGLKPRVKLEVNSQTYQEPQNNVNIIGELKGSDARLKDEVVMAGAHFDSWHSANGATDNGANCVVLLEALKLLKQSGLQPRRTIRIAFWGGEEQAFAGSVDYAAQHFGGLKEQPNAESKKVSAYFNLDNGAGAIRGIYLQKSEMARPVMEDILAPLKSLGVSALTIENTLSTDHETFDHYNIPAFQMIQDPLNYETLRHHTNLDLPEFVPEADLRKNVVIMAWILYSVANRDELLPRKK